MYSSGITQQLFDACFLVMPFLPWFYYRADLYLDSITFNWRSLYWKNIVLSQALLEKFLYVFIWEGWPSLEKEMATHSSFLAWRILWMEEPGGLLCIGLHRVGHDRGDLACIHALEKEMATHSSVLAWRIPGTVEPGGLPSTGSHRVGHD